MVSFFSRVGSARKVSSDWSQKTMTHVILSIVSVLFGVTFPFRAAARWPIFCASTDSECVNFTTLSGMSRSRFFSNNLTTDSDLYLKSWFAFNGSAGDLIATSCVASNHCGTSVPGWMLGRHPSVVEGVVRRFACFSQKQQCCMYSVSMRVRNCSSFYVYKLDSMPSLSVSFRLCGAGIEGTANTVWTNVHLLFRLKSF